MTLNVIKTLHKALLKYLTNDSKDRGNTALTGNGTAAQRRARMEGRVYGISCSTPCAVAVGRVLVAAAARLGFRSTPTRLPLHTAAVVFQVLGPAHAEVYGDTHIVGPVVHLDNTDEHAVALQPARGDFQELFGSIDSPVCTPGRVRRAVRTCTLSFSTHRDGSTHLTFSRARAIVCKEAVAVAMQHHGLHTGTTGIAGPIVTRGDLAGLALL